MAPFDWLTQRHARTALERELLPAPPGPTQWWPAPALLLAGALVLGVYVLTRRKRPSP